MPASLFQFDNSYARDLPGFSVPAPDLLYFNRALALELGLDPDVLDGPDGAAIFTDNRVPEGAEPLAQAYATSSGASPPQHGKSDGPLPHLL